MKKETSIYLDLVRFLAAFVVLVVHAKDERLTGGFLWQLGGYGQTAVMIFFVMSGYVIAYVVNERENTLNKYVLARCARLFSVIIPALIITLICNELGNYLISESYKGPWNTNEEYYWSRYIVALFFGQAIWSGGFSPTNNGAFWSITYEAAYYAFFAIWIFIPSLKTKSILLVVLAAVVGPTVVLLLPIWMMGVAVYKIHRRNFQVHPAICFIIFAISLILLLFSQQYREAFEFKASWLSRNCMIGDYIDGILFSIHLLVLPQTIRYFKYPLNLLEKPIVFFASLTFSLYLFHLPIIRFLGVISPFEEVSSWQQVLYIYGVTLLTVIVIGRPIERSKYKLKLYLQRLVKIRA